MHKLTIDNCYETLSQCEVASMCSTSGEFNKLGDTETDEDKEAAPGEDAEDEMEDGPGGAEVVQVGAGGAEEAAEEPSAKEDYK